ncbi:MAG: hypothetical protein ACM3O7_07600, partial [Acidobacteriota bacterium]
GMAEAIAVRGALRALAAQTAGGPRQRELARLAATDLAKAANVDAGLAAKYRQALERARRLAGS